jgi:hypothetical protein
VVVRFEVLRLEAQFEVGSLVRIWSRFSKLLHKRIGIHQGMKSALGKHWDAFVKSSIEVGKPIFIEAFRPGNVHCRGTITGTPCQCDPATLKLGDIHLDHT